MPQYYFHIYIFFSAPNNYEQVEIRPKSIEVKEKVKAEAREEVERVGVLDVEPQTANHTEESTLDPEHQDSPLPKKEPLEMLAKAGKFSSSR